MNVVSDALSHRHRVVVIGAGFGGLAVAKGLRHAPVDVDVVDANNFHLFQPLLYQVATAGLDSDDVAYAVRGVFRGQRNVNVHMATVTGVDIDARTVTLDRGDGVVDQLPYDTLVVAAGAVSTSYGIDGVDEHTIPLKDLDDALDLRLSVLERFERAASDPSSIDRGELNVVLCGGGPTGVETAGAMMELFTRVLAKDFPQPRRPPGAGRPRRGRAAAARGDVAEVERSSAADAVPPRRRGARRRRRRPGDSGRSASPRPPHRRHGAARRRRRVGGRRARQPARRDARRRVDQGWTHRRRVRPEVPGHPEVFAIGDIAASPAPQLAGVEAPGGAAAGGPAGDPGRPSRRRQIVRRLDGRPTEPFHYHDKGTMATIGRHDAVTELPSGLRLVGFARLARLARPAPRVPHRLPQPGQRARQLGVELPHVRPPQPHRRRPRRSPRSRSHSDPPVQASVSVSGSTARSATPRRRRR